MPNVNVLRASFRNHTVPAQLRGVTVHQRFGKHGLAVLDYQFRAKRQYTMPKSETPVRLQWGRSPLGTKNFYGYVNHYDTDNQDSETLTKMYVLGTSKVFNSSQPNTWHGMTHSGIARDFARRHRMRSVVTPSKRTMPTWSTGTRSDFLAFNALCTEFGYYGWIDGPTLYFLNPQQVLRSAANMRPMRIQRRQVHQASVTAGRDAPRDDITPARRRVLYGLDYRTNEFFTATGGDKKDLTETINAPANDYNQAVEATAAAAFGDEDYYTLSMTMDGNAHVYPGSLVYVAPGQVDTDQQGYWFVTDATHQVSPDSFVTTWSGVRGTDSTPRATQFSTVSGAPRQTGAVVRRDNLWEAEVQEHINA